MRDLIHKMKSWNMSSLLEILDSTYKISNFFATYYECFERRAGEKLVLLQNVMSNPTPEAKWIYITWRLISAISISNALEIYELLNVNLKLEHIRGESFYSGIPPITQTEIDLAVKIRKFYTNLQPLIKKEINDVIKDTYGVEEGEFGEGVDNINDLPNILIPTARGFEAFCPAIIMDDGKYHIWNR